MNQDKRNTVRILADVVEAYVPSKTLPPQVLITLHNSIQGIAESEGRSIQKMEPFKNSPGTAANYDIAVASKAELEIAADALKKEDLKTAADCLLYVAEGCPPSDPPGDGE